MTRSMSGVAALLTAATLAAWGQSYSIPSQVLDGVGRRTAGGDYLNISAAAQPGGIQSSAAGGYVNYAGFLGTFALQPGLDTDGDGLADELDDDNDDDGLTDPTELAGSGFAPTTTTDPNDPDCDGDGMGDGNEAAAGTDPWDETGLLYITDIARGPGGQDVTVTWRARHGRVYRIYRLDDPAGAAGAYLGEVTADDPGASPPWFATDAGYEDAGGGAPEAGFYYITTEP